MVSNYRRLSIGRGIVSFRLNFNKITRYFHVHRNVKKILFCILIFNLMLLKWLLKGLVCPIKLSYFWTICLLTYWFWSSNFTKGNLSCYGILISHWKDFITSSQRYIKLDTNSDMSKYQIQTMTCKDIKIPKTTNQIFKIPSVTYQIIKIQTVTC